MNYKLMILLASTLLLVACTKQREMDDEPPTESLFVNLSINTLAINDPNSINQDQTFSSLAIYLYNNDATSTAEQSLLLPSFSSVGVKEIPVTTQEGVKLLYVIANYANKVFKLTDGTVLTLSPTTTKQQLDDIITESSGGFSPNSLLMIGKQTMRMTAATNGTFIDVALRRLQARVDVHIYKGVNLLSKVVTLQSVTLHNQVLNSEVKFDYTIAGARMLTSPMFSNQTISNSSTLLPYVAGILNPASAKAVFYTYQNLSTSAVQASAPYLEIKLSIAGLIGVRTYKGYFTDNNQTVNKYSLLQNNVYQITATLDVDSKLILNVNVLPWNKTNIEYERPITANDFSFGAWGTSWGGANGKTMNTNVGALEDAVFQFELKAPTGAAWAATLTNGLDFAFAPSTSGTTTATVSNGFTNMGSPSLIAVRATKRWTGESRDTDFYITVEGNEVPINPIIVGTQRKYDGTETRIKIKQVAFYN